MPPATLRTVRGPARDRPRQLPVRPRVEVAPANGTGPVVTCSGEFDAANSDAIAGALASAASAGAKVVLLDLRAVPFIDAAVLAEIAGADARLRSRGSALAVAAGPGQPRRLLELTGLAQPVA